MPRIYVEFAGLKQAGTTCRDVSSKVSDIRSNFKNTIRQLDWDVKFQSDINSTASQLSRKLDAYAAALKNTNSFWTRHTVHIGSWTSWSLMVLAT